MSTGVEIAPSNQTILFPGEQWYDSFDGIRVAGTELISSQAIAERIGEMAVDISEAYKDRNPHFVGVMQGAQRTLAAIQQALAEVDPALAARSSVDTIGLSSYGAGITSSGKVKLVTPPRMSFEGRDIVLVEDIQDTGRTIAWGHEYAISEGARSFGVVTLLERKGALVVPTERLGKVISTGFKIEGDAFVAGFGIDWAERFRGLNNIIGIRSETAHKIGDSHERF